MISLRVSVNGNLRTIDTMATRLEDLALPLEQWNKYKRKQVQAIFDAGGPGWPAKAGAQHGPQTASQADATAAKTKALADNILRIKLRAELRRAQRKHARGKGNESKSAQTMARRYAVLKEFERLAAGGDPTKGMTGDAKLDKSVRGLRERHARASVKAASRPLGRIAQSIRSKLEKSTVSIYSTIPWSSAHNEGATVGHGAKLPQRQFLDVTETDTAVLLMLITAYVQGRGG